MSSDRCHSGSSRIFDSTPLSPIRRTDPSISYIPAKYLPSLYRWIDQHGSQEADRRRWRRTEPQREQRRRALELPVCTTSTFPTSDAADQQPSLRSVSGSRQRWEQPTKQSSSQQFAKSTSGRTVDPEIIRHVLSSFLSQSRLCTYKSSQSPGTVYLSECRYSSIMAGGQTRQVLVHITRRNMSHLLGFLHLPQNHKVRTRLLLVLPFASHTCQSQQQQMPLLCHDHLLIRCPTRLGANIHASGCQSDHATR